MITHESLLLYGGYALQTSRTPRVGSKFSADPLLTVQLMWPGTWVDDRQKSSALRSERDVTQKIIQLLPIASVCLPVSRQPVWKSARHSTLFSFLYSSLRTEQMDDRGLNKARNTFSWKLLIFVTNWSSNFITEWKHKFMYCHNGICLVLSVSKVACIHRVSISG